MNNNGLGLIQKDIIKEKSIKGNMKKSKDLKKIISLDISYELFIKYGISITKKEKTILDKILFESEDIELIKVELDSIRELGKITDEIEKNLIQRMKKGNYRPTVIINELKAYREGKNLFDKDEISIFDKYIGLKYGYVLAMKEVFAYRIICSLNNTDEIKVAGMFLSKKRPTVIIEEIERFRKKRLG